MKRFSIAVESEDGITFIAEIDSTSFQASAEGESLSEALLHISEEIAVQEERLAEAEPEPVIDSGTFDFRTGKVNYECLSE